MSKKQSANKIPYSFFDRIADAALIGALFAILPLSPLRLENFVSDKNALLGVFILLIIATWIAKFLDGWRPNWHSTLMHPIVFGAISLVLFSLLSTIFSLNPLLSWAGKARYPNGLYSLLLYVVLMLQMANSAPRIWTVITPSVVALFTVQLLWAVIIDPRAGAQWLMSVAGNPNYLASWLVIAIFVLAHALYSHWVFPPENTSSRRSKKQATPDNKRRYIIFLALIIGLAASVMMIGGGRGALLALIIASAGTITMLGVIQRRFRLVFATIGGVALLFIIFVILTAFVPQVQQYVRVFRLGDTRRYDLWAGGADAAIQMNEALIDYRENEDNFSLLRPILGYGPDTVSDFQSRWGAEGYYASSSRLSFHNHLLDTMTERGTFGLVSWVLVFGAVVYLLLKELNWLSIRQIPLLIGLMLIVASLVTGILTWIAAENGLKSVIAIGIGLSFPLTIYLWGMIQEFRHFRAEKPQFELTQKSIFLIFMTNLILAHWIDIQFSFGQPLSEPLFWIILGWIVYRTQAHAEPEPKAIISTSQAWLVTIPLAGLHIIHLKNSVHFSALKPSLAELSLMLIVVFVVGIIGAFLSQKTRENKNWSTLWFGAGFGIVLLIIGSLMTNYMKEQLDAVAIPHSADSLPLIFIIGSASTIFLCIGVLLLWMLPNSSYATKIPRIGLAIVVIGFLIGSTTYVMDFMGAATSRIIWIYANGADVESYENTMAIADKMENYIAPSRDIYIPRIFADINYAAISGQREAMKPQIDEAWRTILDIEPYFNNSAAAWLLISMYETLYNTPPPMD